MVMLVAGVMFTVILFTDVSTIIPTSKKVTVTFHKYRKSWNRAQEICETLGGSLYTEDSPEKKAVLVKYRADWNEPGNLEYYVWIGLHALETGGIYTWVYGKPSCQSVDPSIYSNWEPGETLDDGSKRCAHQYLTKSSWTVGKCQWSLYKFVCETLKSTSCTFTESTGTPKSSLSGQFQTQASVRPDYTTCRDECLTSVYNDLNCWAAVYYTTTCVLYYMTDPFLLSDSGNIDPSSHQLFIKDCYTSDTDTTDDTATTSGNHADPRMGCTSIATTSTSSTSSTTSSTTSQTTSSTTSPTTTSSTTSPTTSSTTSSSTTSPTTSSTTSPTTSSTTSPTTSPTTSSTTSPTTSSTTSQTTSSTTSQTTSSTTFPTTSSTTPPTTSSSTSSTTPTTTSSANQSPSSSPPPSISSTTPLGSNTTSSSSSLSNQTSSTSASLSSNCGCLCNDLKTMVRNFSTDPEFANLTSDEILEKLILQLRVNKSTLSATVRKKTSATDNRPSAVSIGAVAAVFLATEFALFMAGDIAQLTVYVVEKIQALIL